MSNRRIYYATESMALGPNSTTAYNAVHGAQSCGINTNYTLENVQEIGQLSVYQLVELLPEVEITAEKVLDGYPLLYHLATQGSPNITDGSLVGRSNAQCMFALSVYGDTQGAASGTPTSQVQCSGMWFSQSGFNFPTDSTFKETITLVGNNKTSFNSNFTFTPSFTNNDAPLAIAGSGGVQIRQDMIFAPIFGGSGYAGTLENVQTVDVNGQINAFYTILPPDIPGISASGTNNYVNGDFSAHISNISVNVNAGRDSVFELGRRFPYFRFVNFPVAVNCEISVIASQVDPLVATELGIDGQGNDVVNRTIKLRTKEGTWINLGTNNKCQSVSYTGGNADGGNVSTTFSYITYSIYYVAHPQDPSVLNGTLVYPY